MSVLQSLNFAGIVGLATLSYASYKLATIVLLYTRSSGLPKYLVEDAYAVVTGASDGIGATFADALASYGFNVILHGRNPAKLDAMKASLLAKYGHRKFDTLLAHAEDQNIDFEGLVAPLQDKIVTVLVNNVGGAATPEKYAYLEQKSTEDVDKDLNLNARFPPQFTRAMIPILARSRASLIMNIGSMASLYGAPMLCIYAGSKGFNQSWSKTLGLEMKIQQKGIDVMFVQCGQVQSNVLQGLKGIWVVTTTEFVSGAIGLIGCGNDMVFGSWKHFLLNSLVQCLPLSVQEKFVIDENRRAMEEIKKER
ncbi:MAG: hypothetical protein M1828_003197 [Chrysothrix sp. TS-e1954]|nr:MAG: hypothetical protein M1828_003197 [Chrysothrix sp. TS-e1954]